MGDVGEETAREMVFHVFRCWDVFTGVGGFCLGGVGEGEVWGVGEETEGARTVVGGGGRADEHGEEFAGRGERDVDEEGGRVVGRDGRSEVEAVGVVSENKREGGRGRRQVEGGELRVGDVLVEGVRRGGGQVGSVRRMGGGVGVGVVVVVVVFVGAGHCEVGGEGEGEKTVGREIVSMAISYFPPSKRSQGSGWTGLSLVCKGDFEVGFVGFLSFFDLNTLHSTLYTLHTTQYKIQNE